MSGGRKRMPKQTCPSLYGGRDEQELDVEEQVGREEEPTRSSSLRQRRLEFVTRTTTTTGDGGNGGGGGGGDDVAHDARCHNAGGSSSGLRKPYERGPSTLPTQKAAPPPAQGDCARRERVSKLFCSYCSHSMLKTELQTNNFC
jgi:hypothetical protein